MIRFTITLDFEGSDESEVERVIDRLLDNGVLQEAIAEAIEDQGFDAVITNAKCDSGEEDPEDETEEG